MTRLHPGTEDLCIGARDRVAEHTQIQLALVRERSHGQTLVSGERKDRKGFDKPGTECVERHRRTWNICHDQIEKWLVVHDSGSLGQDVLGDWFEESQEGGGGQRLVTAFVLADLGRYRLQHVQGVV